MTHLRIEGAYSEFPIRFDSTRLNSIWCASSLSGKYQSQSRRQNARISEHRARKPYPTPGMHKNLVPGRPPDQILWVALKSFIVINLFPLHTEVHSNPYARSRKRRITVRFTAQSKIVGPQYGCHNFGPQICRWLV